MVLPPTLAQELRDQDPDSPFGFLCNAAEVGKPDVLHERREALLVCMQHLQLFVPSPLMCSLNAEVRRLLTAFC